MGVKMLNRFLRYKTPDCIRLTNMSSYRQKRIVVDASIYMYRYIGDNALIENYYLLCSLFRHNQISALFVFDGTPPKEKSTELNERAKTKKKVKEELTVLEEQMKTANKEEIKELETMKNELARQCINIKQWHLNDVKQIIEGCGYTYIEAPGEADHLCAKLVRDGIADACLSEDMDMFVHGCPCILRYMSLTKETFVEYKLNDILDKLEISFIEFQELCVLSGTDYTKWIAEFKHHQQNIFQYYTQIQEFHNQTPSSTKYFKNNSQKTSFLDWLLDTNILDEEEYTHLQHILSFFESQNYPELNHEDYCRPIVFKSINQNTLRKILSYHGFY